MGPKVISLGSINLDLELRVDRWPNPSETIAGADFEMLGGGKAANVAVAATKLGADCLLLGRVGRDPLADRALATLRVLGTGTDGVRFTSDVPTGIAMIFVRPDGERTIVLAENANQRWTRTDVASLVHEIDCAPQDSVLVVDAEISHDALLAAVIAAKRNGLRIILDPSPASRIDDGLIARVDILVPNAAEATQLTGRSIETEENAMLAAELLLGRGVEAALVKLPGGGVAVASTELRVVISGPKVTVVDKTGAGDAFAGALAVALLEGHPLEEAARFASAAAAFCVTRYGCQHSYGTREEIETLERSVHEEARTHRVAS